MLSENQMVKVRQVIEKTYIGTCTISEYQSYKKENKSTGHREVPVIEDEPCKLSYSKVTNVNQGETAAALIQTAKVFISPDIQIKPGSKLTVTQNKITTEFKNSGEPANYGTHQEIVLELFKGWS